MNTKETNRFKQLLEIKLTKFKCCNDFRYSREIIKKYFPNENINEFIETCEADGGFCDCEILMNVLYN